MYIALVNAASSVSVICRKTHPQTHVNERFSHRFIVIGIFVGFSCPSFGAGQASELHSGLSCSKVISYFVCPTPPWAYDSLACFFFEKA